MLDVTKNNCFHYDTVICCIKLTELTSFDFDYNRAMAPRAMALCWHLFPFSSQTRCLFKGGSNSSKYGHAFNLVCLKSLDSTR